MSRPVIPLLSVDRLSVAFEGRGSSVRAVNDVSFKLGEGEAVGIVGESGSGKSVTALAVARLLPRNGRIVGGRVTLRGEDLQSLSEARMRRVRRSDIAMIFQDPVAALNPLLTIEAQVGEGITDEPSRAARHDRVVEALAAVRIRDPDRVARSYPFQLSGGMQQRAAIAAGLIRRPSVLIADEPTTALDATVQLQILSLLSDLQAEYGMSIVLISHDLGVIASLCSTVYVMYASEVVEVGAASDLYAHPLHPYTASLLAAVLDPADERRRVRALPGALPDPAAPPPGCRFSPRCPRAMQRCFSEAPPVFRPDGARDVRCWLYAG